MRTALVASMLLLLPCCGSDRSPEPPGDGTEETGSKDAQPVDPRNPDGASPLCSSDLGDPSVATIDGEVEEGAFAALAQGPDGDLWIAYGDLGSDRLLFALGGDGGWAVEEIAAGAVDLGGWFGRSIDVAPDPDGRPCVAFFHQGAMDLRLACRAGPSDWVVEVVDGAATAGKDVAMAVDASIHLVYLDFLEGDLRHARGVPGAWETRILDDEGYVGNDPSIALAGDGTVHLAYYSCGALGMDGCSDGALRYGRLVDGDFSFEVIDDAGDTGWYSSIALGSDGTVHVAYQSHSEGLLRYAFGGPGAWTLETVDDGGAAGEYASLVLAGNRVLIASRDGEADALELAERAGPDAWTLTTVDTGDAGAYASLLLSDDCSLACAHNAGPTGALRLARWPAR
ncbi:MAG: hypothetical protein ABIK09_15975 [Pseudomonadota bacterium]